MILFHFPDLHIVTFLHRKRESPRNQGTLMSQESPMEIPPVFPYQRTGKIGCSCSLIFFWFLEAIFSKKRWMGQTLTRYGKHLEKKKIICDFIFRCRKVTLFSFKKEEGTWSITIYLSCPSQGYLLHSMAFSCRYN